MSSKIRLFTPNRITESCDLNFPKEDLHYLHNVMKLKKGDRFNVFNDIDGEWSVMIDNKNIMLPIKKIREPYREVKKVALFFGLLKNQNNYLVIQKASELGVTDIFPLIFDRSISKHINITKSFKIAKEAIEQSNRLKIPRIHFPKNFREKEIFNDWEFIVCQPDLKALSILEYSNYIAKSKNIAVIVGSEGGFSKTEIEYFNSKENFKTANLSNYTLRSETAIISSIFTLNLLS